MMNFRNRRDALRLSGANILAYHEVEVHNPRHHHGVIRCPSPDHEDRNPSCSVNLGNGYFKCFSCPAKGDIVDLHGLLGGITTPLESLVDLERLNGTAMPAPKLVTSRPTGRSGSSKRKYPGTPIIAKTWPYLDADGTPMFEVARVEFQTSSGDVVRQADSGKPVKEFWPRSPGGIRLGYPPEFANGKLRPLYNLPGILTTMLEDHVWVVEGEAAADAIMATGRTATTSSGGAAAAAKTDWSPLSCGSVIIWPDNDEAGWAFAENVRGILSRLECRPSVRVLTNLPASLPLGGDAVDWANPNHQASQVSRGPQS
jgi:CHC2-type zinc finger protein